MIVTIDFETRSAADLRKVGAWKYSEHPTTEVLCLGVKEEGLLPGIIGPGDISVAATMIRQATEIHAHNLFFETSIWANVCVPRYGWPPLPVEKLRDTAAVAAMHALPRKLADAGAALGLSIQKDKEGARLIQKLCKPRRVRKGEAPGIYWNEDPADLAALYEYCKRDCEAEEQVMLALHNLPPKELQLFLLDQRINRRGIRVDLTAAHAMVEMIEAHESRLLARLRDLTHGAVRTARQNEALIAFLRGLGCNMPNMQAATVSAVLGQPDEEDEGILNDWDDAPPEPAEKPAPLHPLAREILEIRRSLARSSGTKYQAMIRCAGRDGRVRGTLVYHGAGTGRWTGSLIQPQNYASRIKVSGKPEEMLAAVVAGGLPLLEALYDDDPMMVAGACARSAIEAAPGCDFVVADLSAVEGRGLAWLAGESWVIREYERFDREGGPDNYMVAAGKILGKKAADVTKPERDLIGKPAELYCGFGGSVGAVRRAKACAGMTDDEVKEKIIKPWRESHPMTVAFWYALEEAALAAVAEPGIITNARAIKFVVRDKFLKIMLPGGRILYYYDPKVQDTETSWGAIKPAVTYMGVDAKTKQWLRQHTYGGSLAENVTQATCRDIMAEAMPRVEAAGYPINITVHDEILAEVPEGFGSVEEFVGIICQVPAWAKGFPIKANGWRGKRYKK